VDEEGFEEEDETRKRSHEDMEETFEEQASEEDFEEEGEIPMVSGKNIKNGWYIKSFVLIKHDLKSMAR
jgi:hypothetical protein